MLAYSSIAHAGFILAGFASRTRTAIGAALFYLVAYGLAVLGAFGVVMLVSGGVRETPGLDRYRVSLAAARCWPGC